MTRRGDVRTTVPSSLLAHRRMAELREWWVMRSIARLARTPHSERTRRRLAAMRTWCALTHAPRLTTARASAAAERRLAELRASWWHRRPERRHLRAAEFS